MITEDFLHYLWKLKLIDFSKLVSESGEQIQILNVGEFNTNSGPDFFNAKVAISGQIWAGNIEMHIKSSDWYVHNHEHDKAYDNVILHVVWEHDVNIFRNDNSIITTLVLKPYVDKVLIEKYKNLVYRKQAFISCEKSISSIDNFTLCNWFESLYIERLQVKSKLILTLLQQYNNDWETVLFKLLAKNFGLKVNGNAFFSMANSFDFAIFRKVSHQIIQSEALLFGQASLLQNEVDDVYFKELKQEYSFLQIKYKLKPIHQAEIKFFRLRPSNFPTIRLSQLANLYTIHTNLFSKLMELDKLEDFYKLLQVGVSDYWLTHYSFNSESKKTSKRITKSFIDLLLINTIIPLKFVYQQYYGKLNEELLFKLIQQIKPEKNSIIDQFKKIKISVNNALETQALLELKITYCEKQRCLNCVIGNQLLNSTSNYN